jgi:hypothetical protein
VFDARHGDGDGYIQWNQQFLDLQCT